MSMSPSSLSWSSSSCRGSSSSGPRPRGGPGAALRDDQRRRGVQADDVAGRPRLAREDAPEARRGARRRLDASGADAARARGPPPRRVTVNARDRAVRHLGDGALALERELVEAARAVHDPARARAPSRRSASAMRLDPARGRRRRPAGARRRPGWRAGRAG